jgi:hypothetical protein
MLPRHYGFSTGLDHCLVKEPLGNSIGWTHPIKVILTISPKHWDRIKVLQEIPKTSGYRPMQRDCWPPDIIALALSKKLFNGLPPRTNSCRPTRPQSRHLRHNSFLWPLSLRALMPNLKNIPTTNLHDSHFYKATTFLC